MDSEFPSHYWKGNQVSKEKEKAEAKEKKGDGKGGKKNTCYLSKKAKNKNCENVKSNISKTSF